MKKKQKVVPILMELLNSQEIQLPRFSTKSTKTILTFLFQISLEDFKNCIEPLRAAIDWNFIKILRKFHIISLLLLPWKVRTFMAGSETARFLELKIKPMKSIQSE